MKYRYLLLLASFVGINHLSVNAFHESMPPVYFSDGKYNINTSENDVFDYSGYIDGNTHYRMTFVGNNTEVNINRDSYQNMRVMIEGFNPNLMPFHSGFGVTYYNYILPGNFNINSVGNISNNQSVINITQDPNKSNSGVLVRMINKTPLSGQTITFSGKGHSFMYERKYHLHPTLTKGNLLSGIRQLIVKKNSNLELNNDLSFNNFYYPNNASLPRDEYNNYSHNNQTSWIVSEIGITLEDNAELIPRGSSGSNVYYEELYSQPPSSILFNIHKNATIKLWESLIFNKNNISGLSSNLEGKTITLISNDINKKLTISEEFFDNGGVTTNDATVFIFDVPQELQAKGFVPYDFGKYIIGDNLPGKFYYLKELEATTYLNTTTGDRQFGDNLGIDLSSDNQNVYLGNGKSLNVLVNIDGGNLSSSDDYKAINFSQVGNDSDTFSGNLNLGIEIGGLDSSNIGDHIARSPSFPNVVNISKLSDGISFGLDVNMNTVGWGSLNKSSDGSSYDIDILGSGNKTSFGNSEVSADKLYFITNDNSDSVSYDLPVIYNLVTGDYSKYIVHNLSSGDGNLLPSDSVSGRVIYTVGKNSISNDNIVSISDKLSGMKDSSLISNMLIGHDISEVNLSWSYYNEGITEKYFTALENNKVITAISGDQGLNLDLDTLKLNDSNEYVANQLGSSEEINLSSLISDFTSQKAVISDNETRIQDLIVKRDELNQLNSNLKTEQETLNNQIGVLQNSNTTLSGEISTLSDKIIVLENDIVGLNDRIAQYDANILSLQESNNAYRNTISDLESSNSTLQSNLTNKSNELNIKIAEVVDLTEDLNISESKINNLNNTIFSLNETINSNNTTIEDITNQKNNLLTAKSNLEELNNSLSSENVDLKDRISDINITVDNYLEDIKGLESNITSLNGLNDDLEERNRILITDNSTLTSTNGVLEKKISDLESSNSNLESRISTNIDTISRLTSELDTLKSASSGDELTILDLNNTIASLNETINQNTITIEDITNQRNDLLTAKSDLEKLNDSISVANSDLKNKISDINVTVDKHLNDIKNLESNRNSLEILNTELKQQNTGLISDNSTLKQKITILQDRESAILNQIKVVENIFNQKFLDNADIPSALGKINESITSLQSDNKTATDVLNNKIADLQKSYEVLESEHATRISNKNKEIEVLQSKQDSLNKRISEIADEKSGTKLSLESQVKQLEQTKTQNLLEKDILVEQHNKQLISLNNEITNLNNNISDFKGEKISSEKLIDETNQSYKGIFNNLGSNLKEMISNLEKKINESNLFTENEKGKIIESLSLISNEHNHLISDKEFLQKEVLSQYNKAKKIQEDIAAKEKEIQNAVDNIITSEDIMKDPSVLSKVPNSEKAKKLEEVLSKYLKDFESILSGNNSANKKYTPEQIKELRAGILYYFQQLNENQIYLNHPGVGIGAQGALSAPAAGQCKSYFNSGPWFKVFGGWTDYQNKDDANDKYNSTIGGVIAAYDQAINNNWMVGLGLQYVSFQAEHMGSNIGDKSKANSIGLVVQTRYENDIIKSHLITNLLIGNNHIEDNKQKVSDGENIVGRGQHGTYGMLVNIGSKYKLPQLQNNIYLTPGIELKTTGALDNEYEENGAGIKNLKFSRQYSLTTKLSPGLDAKFMGKINERNLYEITGGVAVNIPVFTLTSDDNLKFKWHNDNLIQNDQKIKTIQINKTDFTFKIGAKAENDKYETQINYEHTNNFVDTQKHLFSFKLKMNV